MTTQADLRLARQPLRLWPGIALAIAVLVARYVAPALLPAIPEVAVLGILVGALGGVLVLVWWLSFSRAAWMDRLMALAAIAAAFAVLKPAVDPSIGTGAMGMLFYILSIPLLAMAFPAWAATTRRLPDRVRRMTMVVTIFATCASLVFIRTGGFDSKFDNDFAWRWSKTAEQRLVEETAPAPAIVPATIPAPATPTATSPTPVSAAPVSPAGTPEIGPAAAVATTAAAAPAVPPPAPIAAAAATPAVMRIEWPGFRGAHRDGVVAGTHIATDWAASPPLPL